MKTAKTTQASLPSSHEGGETVEITSNQKTCQEPAPGPSTKSPPSKSGADSPESSLTAFSKTVVIAASVKGGVMKSSSALDLIDMASRCGQGVIVYNGDRDNAAGIQAFLPPEMVVPLNIANEEDLFIALADFSNRPEHLAVIDLPGAVNSIVGPWLRDQSALLTQLGLSLHVLLNLTAEPGTVEGARAWAKMLGSVAGYTAFEGQKDGPFSLNNTEIGVKLARVCGGRVIRIQTLSHRLLEIYRREKLRKSQIVENPRFEVIDRILMEVELTKIWRNLSPVFPSITGIPAPEPSAWPKASTLPEPTNMRLDTANPEDIANL